MTKVIKIRKGLNIKLLGQAACEVAELPVRGELGLVPSDFEGLTLRLLVAEGDHVEAGQAVFQDKKNTDIQVVTPVSGSVKSVNRGERRVIENVVIEADCAQQYKNFDVSRPVREVLLESGLWPSIMQRPYGIVANPNDTPKAIWVSGFDTAPLAPDLAYALNDSYLDLKKGFEVLGKLTPGKVHLSICGDEGVFEAIGGVEKHYFEGPHPAGNVGTQIALVEPINKGDIIWTVDIQQVAIIGRLFNTGHVDMTKMVAMAGSELNEPKYVRTVAGASVESLTAAAGGVKNSSESQVAGGVKPHARARYISGNPLSGAETKGFLGYYDDQLSVLPEGDRREMLGWAMPRLNKFSVSRTYFSWLQPNKKYVLDTNVNGGVRPFILTGLFERYVPMDIYPMQLLKAIAAEDIDKMEALGIYEIVPEDLALCEFVDPSKNDIQQMVRNGINLLIKEM